MAEYKLKLPAMGEGVIEATITGWLKQVGDFVEADESIVEVATDKVDSEVPSPANGKIKEIKAQINDVVPINGILAILDIEEETESVSQKQPAMEEEEPIKEDELPETVIQEIVQPIDKALNVTSSEENFYSPLVKSIIQTEEITEDELQTIRGSGKNGRLTKEDLMLFLENRTSSGMEGKVKHTPVEHRDQENVESYMVTEKELVEPLQKNSVTEHLSQSKEYKDIHLNPSDEIVEMDRMRKLIAKHMVQSKRLAPHVTSVVECDVTNVVKWRNLRKEEFLKKNNEKLTFMPIIVHSLVKAIRDFPMINVSISGDKIIKRGNINIGIATALPNGNLIVPVIKNADQLSLTGLAKQINDITTRARNSKLAPDEVIGGTYTITNIGTFGNLIGTPIINQPQAAIMAVGVINKKPAVIETPNGDLVGVRHKMYLSHTYDHRVIDGALGGGFVKKVADYLEGFDLDTNIY